MPRNKQRGRSLLLGCLVALAGGGASFAGPSEGSDLEFVRKAWNLPATFSASFMDRQLSRMGDRTAIALLKLTVEDGIELEKDVSKVLSLIERSFESPEDIPRDSDRNPGVTLLLLRHLRERETDAELGASIERSIATVSRSTAPQR